MFWQELESDKYKLKSYYNHRESDYHAQLHGLKCDNEVLLKEIEEVKRKNKLSMDQSSRNVEDLMHQIEALKEKLVKVSEPLYIFNQKVTLTTQTRDAGSTEGHRGAEIFAGQFTKNHILQNFRKSNNTYQGLVMVDCYQCLLKRTYWIEQGISGPHQPPLKRAKGGTAPLPPSFGIADSDSFG